MPAVNPVPGALRAAGAPLVYPADYRMRNAEGSLVTALVGTSHEVWSPVKRRIATARPRKWHVAVRLALHARDDVTNYLRDETETPPAMRSSTLGEAIDFLRAHLAPMKRRAFRHL